MPATNDDGSRVASAVCRDIDVGALQEDALNNGGLFLSWQVKVQCLVIVCRADDRPRTRGNNAYLLMGTFGYVVQWERARRKSSR